MANIDHVMSAIDCIVAYSIFAVLLHEFGHILASLLTGLKIKKIGLSWKGFYVRRERGTPWENLFVSLAGPYMNLLALIWYKDCLSFALFSVAFGLFNLIPFMNSDGHHAVKAFQELMKENKN
jgi:Zn-dependent protease